MSTFSDFPGELIAMVFERLDHIDDACSLANCSQRFRAHFVAEKDKIRVSRAILVIQFPCFGTIALLCINTEIEKFGRPRK